MLLYNLYSCKIEESSHFNTSLYAFIFKHIKQTGFVDSASFFYKQFFKFQLAYDKLFYLVQQRLSLEMAVYACIISF